MTTGSTTLLERPTSLRILRKPKVLDRVGFSDQQLLNLEARGEFPRRIQTGLRSVGWLEHEIDAWIGERMRQREDAAKVEEQRVARMPPAVRHRYVREREGDNPPPA
jgi:prophage regulatory protein